MCQNQFCPSRENCYRYKAEPNDYWQAYADFKVPIDQQYCDHYWRISEAWNALEEFKKQKENE